MSTPRNNPGRVQRCSVCANVLSETDAFNYKTVREHAATMQGLLDKYEIGEPHTKLLGIHGALQFQVWMLAARADKRCGLCEVKRQQEVGP